MPINASTPIQVPASTLDKLWLRRIEIIAMTVGGDANATIDMVYYNDDGQRGPIKRLFVQSILNQISEGNTSLANAYQSLLAAIQELEAASGQGD